MQGFVKLPIILLYILRALEASQLSQHIQCGLVDKFFNYLGQNRYIFVKDPFFVNPDLRGQKVSANCDTICKA